MLPLTITSPLFRSTFSIILVRINLTLVCRLSTICFVIDCLALSRNKSRSIQSFPSIRYCITNFFNPDLTLSIGRKSLSLHFFLIRFLNDSRASSTTFGFGGMSFNNQFQQSFIFCLLFA